MIYSIAAKNPNPMVSIDIQSKMNMKLNENSSRLNTYALQLTKNKFDANDLFQDTVLKIIVNAEKFILVSNFKAWSMTIMRNLFISDYRKKKRFQGVLDLCSNDSFINKGKQPVKNEGEISIAYKEMNRMVEELSDNYRRPFLMALKGYHYKEIAEHLNISVSAIKSRIFFARKILQKKYEEANKILAPV